MVCMRQAGLSHMPVPYADLRPSCRHFQEAGAAWGVRRTCQSEAPPQGARRNFCKMRRRCRRRRSRKAAGAA